MATIVVSAPQKAQKHAPVRGTHAAIARSQAFIQTLATQQQSHGGARNMYLSRFPRFHSFDAPLINIRTPAASKIAIQVGYLALMGMILLGAMNPDRALAQK